MGAHRAVDLAHCMIYFYKCFHESLTLSDAQDLRNGCTKFVKILDFARSARGFDHAGIPRDRRWRQHGRCYAVGMTPPSAPKIQLTTTPDYRESYANSVQIRVNLWDFLLLFGRINQTGPENVAIQNFQGIYVSPQQAKALLNVLQQNVTQYETAFGEIRLEPQAGASSVQ